MRNELYLEMVISVVPRSWVNERKKIDQILLFLSCGLWSFGFVVNSRELSHFVSRSSERSLRLSRTSRIIFRKDDFAFIIIGVVRRATKVLGRGSQVYG